MVNEINPPVVENEGDELLTFTLRRPTLWVSVLIPIAFALGLGIGFLTWGRGNQPQVAYQGAEPQTDGAAVAEAEIAEIEEEPVATPQRIDISIEDNDPVRGPEDAPITIIEFSDYECPYCQRYNQEVASRLLKEYEGQIRYIFKDFPLTNVHPNALPAAAAALCAHEQESFWEYHDLLFSMKEGLSSDALLSYAETLELDTESFTQCVGEERYNDEVLADLEFAANLGVRSTPTFLINGLPVIGAQPYEVFAQVIDQELNGGE